MGCMNNDLHTSTINKTGKEAARIGSIAANFINTIHKNVFEHEKFLENMVEKCYTALL